MIPHSTPYNLPLLKSNLTGKNLKTDGHYTIFFPFFKDGPNTNNIEKKEFLLGEMKIEIKKKAI